MKKPGHPGFLLQQNSWKCAAGDARRRSGRQLLLQQLRHLRRIGLALRRLHALADQRVDRRFLAGAVLLDRFGVVGQDLVDDGFQRAGVRDLLQAFALDDGVGQVFVVRLALPTSGRTPSWRRCWRWCRRRCASAAGPAARPRPANRRCRRLRGSGPRRRRPSASWRRPWRFPCRPWRPRLRSSWPWPATRSAPARRIPAGRSRR